MNTSYNNANMDFLTQLQTKVLELKKRRDTISQELTDDRHKMTQLDE